MILAFSPVALNAASSCAAADSASAILSTSDLNAAPRASPPMNFFSPPILDLILLIGAVV